MLRALLLLLVLANLLFYAWTHQWLDGLGLRANTDREPDRLTRQVRPEAIRVQPPGAPASGASAPAAAASSAATTAAAAPAEAGACLEAGPFGAGAVASAAAWLRTAQPPVPQSAWRDTQVERPGSWMLYMGRFADPQALSRKIEELRRARVAFDEVEAPPELAPGLSLGRHDNRAAAERALEQLGQRGVRTARVVELAAPRSEHWLRVDNADRTLATQLLALRGEVIGRGFVPCAGT